LGLFFIAVGMSMNLQPVLERPHVVFGILVAFLALKTVLLYGLVRFFRYAPQEASIFAIALSQGGEFAFVLYSVALQKGVLSSEDAGLFSAVVALSMTLTPLLFLGYERILLPRFRQGEHRESERKYKLESEKNPVILAGYGRIGQVVGRLLTANRIGATILERDPGQIEIVRQFGWKAFYGDVSRLELLEAAGAREAKLLVLAIDDMDAVTRTIELAREHFPHLKVIARAESRIDAYRFVKTGVEVVRTTYAPGLEMAESALRQLGYPAYEARVIGQRFTRQDQKQFDRSVAHLEDRQTLINISAEAKEELLRIMETDEKRRAEHSHHESWGG
jgi:voltage-gated potassium channel Kch